MSLKLLVQLPATMVSAVCCVFLFGALATPSSLAWHGELTSERESEVDTSPSENPSGIAAGDWAGIRAAHQSFRHRALKTEDGFRAFNPGQSWTIDFDGQGFRV